MRSPNILIVLLVGSVLGIASTTLATPTPLTITRTITARSELLIDIETPLVIDDDTLISTGPGFLEDERHSSVVSGLSQSASSAFHTSQISSDAFDATVRIEGFSERLDDILVLQSSPLSGLEYDFQVTEPTFYRFTGRLDASGGGTAIVQLRRWGVTPDIELLLSQSEVFDFDVSGVMEPGTYTFRAEVSAYISPGDVQDAEVTVQGLFDAATGAQDIPDTEPLTLTAGPNPFNPRTTLAFDLPRSARARVGVYDLLGRPVRSLLNEDRPAGRQEVTWNGADDQGRPVPSGTYLCRLEAAGEVVLRRVQLVK